MSLSVEGYCTCRRLGLALLALALLGLPLQAQSDSVVLKSKNITDAVVYPRLSVTTATGGGAGLGVVRVDDAVITFASGNVLIGDATTGAAGAAAGTAGIDLTIVGARAGAAKILGGNYNTFLGADSGTKNTD